MIHHVSVAAGNKVVTLGDVSLEVKQPKNPELVPIKYSKCKSILVLPNLSVGLLKR